LVGREKENKMLEAMYTNLPGTGGMHTFVTGESGLGKTVLVKLFFEKLKEKEKDVDVCYVNCKRYNSPYSVACQILSTYESGSSPSTLGKVSDKLKHILENNHRKLVVVLDELHVLFEEKKNDADRMVYTLTRINDCIPGEPVSLSVVLVSPKNMLKLMSKSTSGIFAHNVINLKRYMEQGLFGIVDQRAGLALSPNVIDDNGKNFIARITEDGNARLAIDILGRSARITENNGENSICAEDIRVAKKSLSMDYGTGVVFDLPLDEKYVFLGVAVGCKKHIEISLRNAYSFYEGVCKEQGDEVKSYRQFKRYVSKLASFGLVGVHDSNKESFVYIDTPAEDLIHGLNDLIGMEKKHLP
jgi:cell division control protein 6